MRRTIAALCLLGIAAALASAQDTLIATELLGRPTATSITVNAVTGYAADGFVKYGTSTDTYSAFSDTVHITADQPLEILVANLQPNTRDFYRLCYRRSGSASFITRDEHTFHTQRAAGATFRFNIEADPHMYDKKGAVGMIRVTMRNQAKDSADFLLDIGDTYGDDHVPADITPAEAMRLHLDYRQYLAPVCNSASFFFCLGNHEGESGYWLLQNPPDNMGVNATLARQFYYPNPVPNNFYSGNTVSEGNGIGLPENYYAWTWGDALFVVLDAYRGYTANAKPIKWDWTLGKTQYDWFVQTLEGSTARYKFVFAHHVLGESRGGASVADGFEWGGMDAGVDKFATYRPGWELPIHQLMVKNKVNIYFQGHDHLFAKEMLDGIVYQEVPMPSDSTYIIGTRDNGSAYGGDTMSSSGHLRVTVGPDKATVDYVRAWMPSDTSATRVNGSVAYSYSVSPNSSSIRSRLTSDHGSTGSLSVTAARVSPNMVAVRCSASNGSPVTIEVYSLGGRLVRSVVLPEVGPEASSLSIATSMGACVVRATSGSSTRSMVLPAF